MQHVDIHISFCCASTWAHPTICSLPHSSQVASEKQPLWQKSTLKTSFPLHNSHYSIFCTNVFCFVYTVFTWMHSTHRYKQRSSLNQRVRSENTFLPWISSPSVSTLSYFCRGQSLLTLMPPLVPCLKLLFPMTAVTKRGPKKTCVNLPNTSFTLTSQSFVLDLFLFFSDVAPIYEHTHSEVFQGTISLVEGGQCGPRRQS